MREMVQQYWKWFLVAALAGLALRLYFVIEFGLAEGDSLVYADIAKNWLLHGIYGITDSGDPRATLMRLPGYPGFLALIFSVFGMDNFTAVRLVQVFIEMLGCVAIAALAKDVLDDKRSAVAAFVISALCPFTANYTARPLTETLSIYCVSIAFLYAVKAGKALDAGDPHLSSWAKCGVAVAGGMLLRPDGGIMLAMIGAWLGWKLIHAGHTQNPAETIKRTLAAGLITLTVSCVALVPWTLRNWQVFHVFQLMAPRYATDPGSYVPEGWYRWVKTWMVDYTSVEEVLWKAGIDYTGEYVDPEALPSRAFDTQQERETTHALFDEYNGTRQLSPELNEKFAALAVQRIERHPLRYYVVLPVMRGLTMWFRPRTEMLGTLLRWWEFDDIPQCLFMVFYAALNLALVGVAIMGAWKRRDAYGWGVMLAFVIVRTLFLITIESPEPRYVLECYPVVFVFAAAMFRSKPTDPISLQIST